MDAVSDALIDELAWLNGRLRNAIAGMTSADLDRTLGPDTNSIAVLVAHVTGSELGWLHRAAGQTYARDREAEFRTRGMSAADLERMIDVAAKAAPELIRAAVAGGLETVRGKHDGRDVPAIFSILHAINHLAEHVGHVELTRQVIEGK